MQDGPPRAKASCAESPATWFRGLTVGLLFLIAILVIAVLARKSPSGSTVTVVKLDALRWQSENLRVLQQLIDANAGQPGMYAVFDWDNTAGLFDAQEQLFAYQIDTLSFAMK